METINITLITDLRLDLEALAILKCDYKEELQDTSELLKRLKEAFDDENISYKDKTTLMLCFLRIKKLLQDLPDDKWATIDRSGSGSSEETDDATSTVRYFNTSAHQNNALMILIMFTISPNGRFVKIFFQILDDLLRSTLRLRYENQCRYVPLEAGPSRHSARHRHGDPGYFRLRRFRHRFRGSDVFIRVLAPYPIRFGRDDLLDYGPNLSLSGRARRGRHFPFP